VECNTCHEVENCQLAVEPAWYEQRTGGYVSIEDTIELCEKCHTDTQMLSLGDKTHAGFSCTTCHDAHRLETSCTNQGCHRSLDSVNPLAINFTHPSNDNCYQAGCHGGFVLTPTPESTVVPRIVWNHRDGNHNAVSCAACHDANGLEVGMLDSVWVTINSSAMEYYPSHNIQRSVDCNRCHFVDNPWGLMDISTANE